MVVDRAPRMMDHVPTSAAAGACKNQKFSSTVFFVGGLH